MDNKTIIEKLDNIKNEISDLAQNIKNDNNSSNSGDDNMNKNLRIAIDSGHGDSDPGAIFIGSNEAQKCREVTNKVIEILKANGYNNVLDVQALASPKASSNTINANLISRCNVANNWNANIYVAIHTNSNSGTPGTGSECYVISKGGDAEKYARRILNRVTYDLGYVDRGIKTANFVVLKDTKCPACLLEMCFGNNPKDVEKFDVYVMARAICSGILDRNF